MKSLLLIVALLGAEPQAVICGPSTALAGDMVILDASDSTGDQFAWALVGPAKSFYVPADKMACVFAYRTPGKYVFALCAFGKGSDGKPASHVTVHEVTLTGDVPPPTPPPVPPPIPPAPDPTPPLPVPVTLADKVHAWAVALPLAVADRQRDAVAMANGFSGVASMIAAGAIQNKADIAPKISSAISQTLGVRAEAWRPWFEKFVDELDVLEDAGRLPDLRAYQAAIEAIAVGLKRAGPAAQPRRGERPAERRARTA